MIKGLYAVTPDIADTQTLCEMVTAALQGGVSILQYRNKLADAVLRHVQASALLPICRQYEVPLIINDDAELCKSLDADGVHLGGTDGNIAAARKLLGANKIIGASCYNRLELAQQAAKQGASYVAFGACFDSITKPNAALASLDLFAQAKKLNLPTVAIGGITPENVQLVKQAGADAVAVINALFGSKNIQTTATEFVHLLNS
ncbi:MAG: thiamine phosphate synthase [Methylotenera sp.]|nr:thiamine phosphate synthase [Methylotenera sp.]